MPERWQSEIRKLRTVEPRPELASRFAEGPRGEQGPSTRQRVIAAVTALALFVAAGAFAIRVFGTGSEPDRRPGGAGEALVLELSSTDQAPALRVRFGERSLEAVVEGYEWCHGEQCAGMISDFVFYPPVGEYVVVPPGTPIEVTGDGSVDEVRVSDPEDRAIPGAPTDAVPGQDGRYVYRVIASWPEGHGTFFFGVQVLASIETAPDELHVDCGTGAALLDSAVVRTRADGLHLVFEGPGDFDGFEIVTPRGTPSEELFGVGARFGPQDRNVVPLEPGRWELGCSSGGRPLTAGEGTVPFELVDPDDHWAPAEIACEGALEESFDTNVPNATPHAEAATQLVQGMLDDDRLRGAGYGAEGWKGGYVYVVDRGGRSLARLVLTEGQGSYLAEFQACPGAGITAVPVAPTIPDVLVIRCEGLGPAVDATEVRLQAGGLHVDALNVEHAELVELIPVEPAQGQAPYRVPFEEAREIFVVDAAPGAWWVGCRVTNEQGEVVGGPEDVPDAYLLVRILPAEG